MEEKKFLDLDHICDRIISDGDRIMFKEAISCYQIGSHRAAIILAWSATADCIYRRVEELAREGDGVAQSSKAVLLNVKGQAVYEENLITEAKKCELFDDYEEKCLRFARDTRSKCAHPTGVIPSAEAVRHILHVCSQFVLCREGYRGMAFIRNFVITKLDDRHLFSDKNRIEDTCQYFYKKVPERIWPQFAAIASEHVKNGFTPHWRSNSVNFFKELITNSIPEMAQKISQKFQEIEGHDRLLFSLVVGIDYRDSIWDAHQRSSAKTYLREALRAGKIDPQVFQSYGNLCSNCEFEEEDKKLIKERFSIIADHIAQHTLLQGKRQTELLSLLIEGVQEENYRQQLLNGAAWLVSSELFAQDAEEIGQFIDELIRSDWREEEINNLFLNSSKWSDQLKVNFLKKTDQFLIECSEDFPDYLLVLFDAANNLLLSNPLLLPAEFERAIIEIVNENQYVVWFDEKGEVFENFIGQIDLLRTKFKADLPRLSEITLPNIEQDEFEEEE